MAETNEQMQLTDARGLLEQLWAKRGRPSLRWLRQQQKANVIPHIKIAGRVFFDPVKVREALTSHRESSGG